ncbi:MAG: hypothetical protein ABIT76_07245 [Chthoniobacterales bacterium]
MEAPNWRKVFLLCLPGLIVGLVLRAWLLAVTPEAYYGPDGGSYWHTAVRLWTEGNLSMFDKRRWLYPAWLCILPLLPVRPIQAVAFFQHLAGLAMVFGGGMVASRCTRQWKIWVPLISLILATWPQTLLLEHSLETETFLVATFMALVFIGLAPGSFSPRRLFWFLLTAALVAAWKPHGRGIWLACLLIAIWKNGSPLHWARRSWGAIVFALVVILSSGSSGQGNWLLLNSVLPLVPLEGRAYPAERAALRPLLLEARGVRQNYAWEQENFKYRLNSPDPENVDPAWARVARDGKHFSRVCRAFAFEGLRSDPLTFLRFTLQKIALSLSENGCIERLEPKKFWHDQNAENATRWKKTPPKELALLYRLDASEYQRMAELGAARKFTPITAIYRIADCWGWFQESLSPQGNTLALRTSGWLALAGLLCTWLPGRFQRFSILWLPAAFYAITVFAMGDRLPRYAYLLNWLGVILAAIALDTVLAVLARFIPQRAEAPPDASRRSATSSPANPFSPEAAPR